MSWSRKLPQPVRLRDGRELITLSDARALILGLPKATLIKSRVRFRTPPQGHVQKEIGVRAIAKEIEAEFPEQKKIADDQIAQLCVPKTRSGRTDDEVRREWDVTAGCQCAELGDARARLCSETGASERHYSSLHRRAARAAGAPRQRQ